MSTTTHTASLEHFLFTHSYLFFQHISRYYALSADLMERYGHLWDFTAISTNDRIDWNLETITRFEDRIYWYFFSMNTGVKWTKTMLERFENRLDWYWLARNPNFPFTDDILETLGTSSRWSSLSCNPALPLTDDFLDKYGEKLSWRWVKNFHEDRLHELSPRYRKKLDDFPDEFQSKRVPLPDQVGAFLKYEKKSGYLPEPLRAALEYPLSHMSDDFLETYAAYLDWSQISRTEHLEWSTGFFERLYRHLTYDVTWNRFFYQTVLAPALDDTLIERICARLHPENQVPFYFLKSASRSRIAAVWNAQGVREGDPFLYQAFSAWFEQGDPELPLPATHFKLDVTDENPVHFTDLLDWRFEDRYPVCLVSDRFKYLLQQFDLPEHRFFPVEVLIDDAFFGSESRTYYLFYVPDRSFLYFDYEKTVFVEEQEEIDRQTYDSIPPYHSNSYFTRQTAPLYPHPVRTPETFAAARKALKEQNPQRWLRPQEYVWKAGFDLITSGDKHLYRPVWVSENIKKAIENTALTGVAFERVWEPRPHMSGLEPPEHRTKVERIQAQLRTAFEKNPEPEQVTVRNFREAQAWAATVSQNSGLVQKLFADNPARYATDDPFLQRIRQKEEELDLLFPDWFIRMLKTGQLPAGLEDFSLHPLESLNRMSWRTDFPLSVKAVEFASYGGTTELFLALRQGSFYELDDAIYLIEYDQGPPPSLVARVDQDGNPVGKIRLY